jgi:hypothetical protein
MNGKTLASYAFGVWLAVMAVLPPIPYTLSIRTEPMFWLAGVVLAGFFGFFLVYCNSMGGWLKALVIYLWLTAFLSTAPFASFNAVALFILAAYVYMALLKSDFNIITRFIEAVFWFELALVVMQLTGHDSLMDFGSKYTVVNDGSGSLIDIQAVAKEGSFFLGTVRQQMRLGSLFAVMAPFLIYRSRLYFIPLFILAYLSKSAGLSTALLAGAVTLTWLNMDRRYRGPLVGLSIAGLSVCLLLWDWGSFYAAFLAGDGRLQIWMVIVKTWLFNTAGPMGSPDFFGISQTGPFDVKSLFFGRGLDTFIYLFPIFKHDPNPFPQAHNCWLQLAWEGGLIGLSIFIGYFVNLVRRLARGYQHELLAGLACISVNAMAAFPTRMVQTGFLLVAFFAMCTAKTRGQL